MYMKNVIRPLKILELEQYIVLYVYFNTKKIDNEDNEANQNCSILNNMMLFKNLNFNCIR